MKVLLIGNGAREHIIAEKIAEDAELYVYMNAKNPAIAALAKKYWIGDTCNGDEISNEIESEGIDLAFSSPDATLAAGVTDALEKKGIQVASPTKEAARIEWDKAFMRSLMKKHRVSGSPKFYLLDNAEDAEDAIEEMRNVVIKPVGLTGGKGVRISGEQIHNKEDALAYVHEILKKDKIFLIEEKLEGEEFSLQVFCDGSRITAMPPVQDHKRAFEGDKGPNTGGMGAYSTGELLPFLEQSDSEQAIGIIQNVVDAMRKEGTEFRGILYGQFMACKNGVRLIEFNARFGDPEAMNVLSLLESSLTEVLFSIAERKIDTPRFRKKSTAVKYTVPEGYPDKPLSDTIVDVNKERIEHNGGKAYFAGVYEKEGRIYTTSSRAFATVGVADSLEEAELIAEKCCRYISGKVWHRRDIGTKELINKKIEHMKKLRIG